MLCITLQTMNGHDLPEGGIDLSDIIYKEVHWIGLEYFIYM